MFKSKYDAYDIRKAIEKYYQLRSFRKTALHCGVSKSTIQRWWSSFHMFVRKPKIQRKKYSRQRKFANLQKDVINLFECRNDALCTLKSIIHKLQLSKPPSLSWLRSVLKGSKIVRKRYTYSFVNPKTSDQMKTLYQEFERSLKSYNADEIVCLDETSFCNIGNAKFCYIRKGEKPSAYKVSKRETFSVVMAISTKGVVCHHIQPRAYNKETFKTFLQHILLPSLPSTTKAVLMDNVRFHHSKDVIALFDSHGLQPLFIPPYSPRCNPIEEVFSLLKRKFRNATAQDKLFREVIDETIGHLNLYKDFSNYYKHAIDHVLSTCQAYV